MKKSWIIGQRSYSGQPALVSSFFSIKQHGTAGGPDIAFAVVIPELAALAGLVQECTARTAVRSATADEGCVGGWHVLVHLRGGGYCFWGRMEVCSRRLPVQCNT